MKALAADLAGDLAAGFGLLTRIPVGWLLAPGMPYRPGRAVWTYPVVGLVTGGVGACCLWLGNAVGLSHALAGCWTLAASVLLTGGLHEDGMADLADGLGGRTKERRLEIMRDSRIGSFGALALVLSLAIRASALAGIAALAPGRAACVLLAVGALSRAAMLPVLSLPPARPDGLGRSLGRIGVETRIAALAIASLVAFATLGLRLGLGLVSLSVLLGSAVAGFARSRIGGVTGDVLGASVVVAECGLLTAATVW